MSLTLGGLVVGEEARIFGYAGRVSNYRRQLLAMGLTPGITCKVIRRAPMGDPVEIEVRGFRLSLRRDEAQCILVHKEKDNGASDCCRSR